MTLQSESSSRATTAEAESLKKYLTIANGMGSSKLKKHAGVRFSQKVRQYLIQKFNIG